MQQSVSSNPFRPCTVGLTRHQLARIATRRAFVEMKQTFMDAVGTLDADEHVATLKDRLRRAQTPEELWLLRGPVFAALRRDTTNGPRLRQEVRRSLATVFPGTFSYSGYATR